LAGVAFTQKAVVTESPDRVATERVRTADNADVQYVFVEGCVLIQDVGNDPVSGGLGENLGLSVQMRGCVGVVCDGGTRDKKALIHAGFPVFSRFSSMTFRRHRRRTLD